MLQEVSISRNACRGGMCCTRIGRRLRYNISISIEDMYKKARQRHCLLKHLRATASLIPERKHQGWTPLLLPRRDIRTVMFDGISIWYDRHKV